MVIPFMSSPTPAPVAQTYSGVIHFPGIYAFLNTPSCPTPALLQFDEPFTGNFDDLKAQNTRGTLQGTFSEGDTCELTGLICQRPVNGITIPVLFLFDASS